MDRGKLSRILEAMKEKNMPQMIISNPYSIYWLTGLMLEPGERLFALYLNVNGNHRLVINELFPQEKDLGVDILWYNDMEDPVEKLSYFVEHDQVIGIDKNWSSGFLLRLQELKAASGYVNGSLIVDQCRQIKDEKEQALMRESSRLNDLAMERLVPLVGKGFTEKELYAKVIGFYKELGCDGISFEPITTYGKGAASPHHITDDTKGKRGDCVVMDIGAYKDGYASDMTRTVFIGEVSDRAREIYETVKEANRRGIEAARPGNRMCDVDAAARDYITEKGFGKYFTHRTGHSIGLEEHEAGDVSPANEEIIRPGQCFSVEPGIYIQEEEIGVRIEDLVLVTEDGCEVLNHFTKDLLIIPEE